MDLFGNQVETKKILKDIFFVEPYSVLDTRATKWQTMKKRLEILLDEKGDTREEENFNIRRNTGIVKRNNKIATEKQKIFQYNEKNISLFDPVLSMVCFNWFGKDKGLVIDPCAGDTRKGNVIALMGGRFLGVDIRESQVLHNNKKAEKGAKWICDDGCNIINYVEKESASMMLSCPPYYDLEVYSDNEQDASNQPTFSSFVEKMNAIYSSAIACLEKDSFACIVIGNVRKKNNVVYGGFYHFKEAIINIFEKNGMCFYNDIVILKKNGTAHMRAVPYMNQKKVVGVHEYLLVFYKGDVKRIKENFI
jgi:hypothetical protein